MKKFILWLASVFNVNLNDVIIKENLKVTGGVTAYYINKLND